MQRQLRYFEMQHERNPRSRHFIALADLKRRSGSPASAIDLLNEGLARYPESLSGRWLLGLCLLETGECAAASDQLQKVIERDPDHTLVEEALTRCGESGTTPVASREVETPIDSDDEAEASIPEAEEPVPDSEAAPEEVKPAPADKADPEVAETVPVSPGSSPPVSATEGSTGISAADTIPEMFVTRTLADIYLEQGHKDKALRILYQVLAAHPEREDIVARIAALEEGTEKTTAQESDVGSGVVDSDTEDRNRSRFDAWVADQDREGRP